MTDNKAALDALDEIKGCPFHPAFNIGDIVEIGGEYAGDWLGTTHYVAEVSWNKRKDRIEYGTYQVDTNDGMTTDWREEHLVLVRKALQSPPAPTVMGDDVAKAVDMLRSVENIYIEEHEAIQTLIQAATRPAVPQEVVETLERGANNVCCVCDSNLYAEKALAILKGEA